jgi:2-dehydropantoate 2-reductase
VKQYQLHTILQKITDSSTTKGSLLFLQNGMGHLEELAKLPNENIFVGSVEHGALRLNENTVQHNGVGVTKVAVYKGDSTQLQSILANNLDSFPFVFEEDYYQMLLKKLIVNSMINPLTAILQVKNGQLIENPQYRLLLSELYEEVAEVLKLDKIHDYWEHVLSVCHNTALNQSSMLKDILNHRETEVDAILGFLIKMAKLSGRNAPLIQTYFHLIKGKEHEGRKRHND